MTHIFGMDSNNTCASNISGGGGRSFAEHLFVGPLLDERVHSANFIVGHEICELIFVLSFRSPFSEAVASQPPPEIREGNDIIQQQWIDGIQTDEDFPKVAQRQMRIENVSFSGLHLPAGLPPPPVPQKHRSQNTVTIHSGSVGRQLLA